MNVTASVGTVVGVVVVVVGAVAVAVVVVGGGAVVVVVVVVGGSVVVVGGADVVVDAVVVVVVGRAVVAVSEGRVLVRGPAEPHDSGGGAGAGGVELGANAQTQYSRGERPYTTMPVDTDAMFAWRTGRIIFEGRPFASAIAELEHLDEQSAQGIEMAQPELPDRSMVGLLHRRHGHEVDALFARLRQLPR